MAVDIYQMVTDRIIEKLEQGIVPWRKPWTRTRSGAFNRINKRPYSLLNQMILKNSGEYATFNQWKQLGGKVRKGEKAEMIVFWKLCAKENPQEDGTTKIDTFPVLRYYNVFHISQIDGVDAMEPEQLPVTNPIDAGDTIISEYISRSGIRYMEQESDKAYYSPSTDAVVVPLKEQFPKISEFYSTAFHELVHSTGHHSRLNRLTQTAAFGDESYSKEELIAEIGSANLMCQAQIETSDSFNNNVAYIQSWLSKLRNDKQLIISAASRAEKAVKLILAESET